MAVINRNYIISQLQTIVNHPALKNIVERRQSPKVKEGYVALQDKTLALNKQPDVSWSVLEIKNRKFWSLLDAIIRELVSDENFFLTLTKDDKDFIAQAYLILIVTNLALLEFVVLLNQGEKIIDQSKLKFILKKYSAAGFSITIISNTLLRQQLDDLFLPISATYLSLPELIKESVRIYSHFIAFLPELTVIPYQNAREQIPFPQLNTSPLICAALSPTQNLLALGFQNGECWLINATNFEKICQLDTNFTLPKSCLQFSADGRFLAFQDEQKISVYLVPEKIGVQSDIQQVDKFVPNLGPPDPMDRLFFIMPQNNNLLIRSGRILYIYHHQFVEEGVKGKNGKCNIAGIFDYAWNRGAVWGNILPWVEENLLLLYADRSISRVKYKRCSITSAKEKPSLSKERRQPDGYTVPNFLLDRPLIIMGREYLIGMVEKSIRNEKICVFSLIKKQQFFLNDIRLQAAGPVNNLLASSNGDTLITVHTAVILLWSNVRGELKFLRGIPHHGLIYIGINYAGDLTWIDRHKKMYSIKCNQPIFRELLPAIAI